jgi:hypothetical protein
VCSPVKLAGNSTYNLSSSDVSSEAGPPVGALSRRVERPVSVLYADGSRHALYRFPVMAGRQ